jgi:hypothetical protein
MPEESRWYLRINEKQFGPIGFSDLETLARAGKVRRSDPVWSPGYESWVEAGSIDALFPQQRPSDSSAQSLASAPVADAEQAEATTADKKGGDTPAPDVARSPPRKRGNYLIRHWRGELSLPVSYWVNGFGGNIVAAVAVAAIMALADREDGFDQLLVLSCTIAGWLTLLGICLWQVVGTWRSAGKYMTAHPTRAWGGVARFALSIAVVAMIGKFVTHGVPQIADLYAIQAGDSRLGQHAFRVLRDGRELEFSGRISFGSAKELERFLDGMGALKVVHLNSHGGRVLEAQRMGDLIKQRNLSTYVSGQCLSACTIIFLSGRERYISADARLGFHQPDFAGATAEERRTMIADEEARLRRLGASEAFARRANQAKPDEIWFPTPAELVAEGVVTRVVQSSDFAISGIAASSINADQIQQRLLAEETYAAIKRIDPVAYATISEKFEEGLRRGASAPELHAQINPVVAAVFTSVLPNLSQESLFEVVRFSVKAAKTFNKESPAACYFYFNPEKTTSRAIFDMRKKYSDLFEEEDALTTKTLQSFAGTNSRIPEEKEIARSLMTVLSALQARYGDDLELMSQDVVPPDKYSAYCSILSNMYELALKLPPNEAYALLRYVLANR